MRRYFVPQRGEKRRQCGALASIFYEVDVQKNKHVEHKPLATEYKYSVFSDLDKFMQLVRHPKM
jgi:hypothetical protein